MDTKIDKEYQKALQKVDDEDKHIQAVDADKREQIKG